MNGETDIPVRGVKPLPPTTNKLLAESGKDSMLLDVLAANY